MLFNSHRIVVLGLLALAPSIAQAESLWNRGRANPLTLVAENRARRVGDIVTIVIEEKQKVNNSESVKTEKSSNSTSSLTFQPGKKIEEDLDDITGGESLLDSLLPIELSSDRDFEGKANFDKSGSFTTRITAVVIDIQPNGNLVVEGRRRVELDGEEKWMTVSGLVRNLDVKSDNTISSALVANADVRYSSKGRLADNTKRGWLDRFVDFIWPF